MAEWLDTKSTVKIGGFRSQLETSSASCYTENVKYNIWL